MLSNMFNHTTLLEKSLDASWLKMEINAQNISNADTPGYDAKRVEFDDAFAKALNGSAVSITTTHEKHFQVNEADPAKVKPTVVSDTHYVARMDDNNVDIDSEMVDMAKNTIQYNALIQKLNSEFSRLKTVIREGR